VRFGNGINGRTRPEDGCVALSYRRTIGRLGNVAPGRTWRITGEPDDVTWTNPAAASGGADRETVEKLVGRARKAVHDVARIVTAEDAATMAGATPGVRVAKTKVVPAHDPDYPGRPRPGHVTVVAMSARRPGRRHTGNRESSAFLGAVSEHLQTGRLLTDVIHVVGPKLVEVTVRARVFVDPAALLDARRLQDDARGALDALLRPLDATGAGGGWPIGRAVHSSGLEEVLHGLEGVRGVALELVVDGVEHDGDVELGPTGVAYGGAHQITVLRAGDTANRDGRYRP
jgi:predicted phage baseplate assembly protein